MSAIRVLIAVLTVASTTSCVAYRPMPGVIGTTTTLPHKVRVNLGDRSVVYLSAPSIERDSIFGRAEAGKALRTGIALDDIRRLEQPRFSKGRTILLAAAVIGAGLVYENTQQPPCPPSRCISLF